MIVTIIIVLLTLAALCLTLLAIIKPISAENRPSRPHLEYKPWVSSNRRKTRFMKHDTGSHLYVDSSSNCLPFMAAGFYASEALDELFEDDEDEIDYIINDYDSGFEDLY